MWVAEAPQRLGLRTHVVRQLRSAKGLADLHYRLPPAIFVASGIARRRSM